MAPHIRAEPRAKDSSARAKNPMPSSTCVNRRGVVVAPVIAKPVEERAPPVAAPEEATNVEEAAPAAVDRSPEKDGFAFPFLRDEVGFGEQVVGDACVQDWLFSQHLSQFIPLDPLAILLTFVEVKRHVGGVPLELATFLMVLDRPAVGNERVSVEVDDVFGHGDFRMAESHSAQLGNIVAGC